MHILMVPSWYPLEPADPNGSFFQEQARVLAEAGNRVGVLAVRNVAVYEGARATYRPRTSSSTEGGVNVVRADRLRLLPKFTCHALRGLLQKAQRAYSIYEKKYGKPEVLHAHSLYPGGIIAAHLGAKHAIAHVITEHRPSMVDRRWPQCAEAQLRSAVAGASALNAVSRDFAEALTQRFTQGGQWGYLPNLLGPTFENFAHQSLSSGENGPVDTGQLDTGRLDTGSGEPTAKRYRFVHASMLDVQVKGIDILLEAFAANFKGCSDVLLRIIGESPELESVRQHARRLGIEGQIEFEGWVSREELPRKLAQCQAFVLPSRVESFGVVLIEALACGLPLVAASHWGGKTVIDSTNGLLCEVGNAQSLGEAMVKIKQNSPNYRAFALQNNCLVEYGRDAFVRKQLEMYQQARNKFGN